MATYNLAALLEWVRRIGSDRLLPQRDVLVTDGTTDSVLSNTGNIQLVNVSVNSVFVYQNGAPVGSPAYTFTLLYNVLTFSPTPASGLSVIAVYNSANFVDVDVLSWIGDAANAVIADLALRSWQTNYTDPNNPMLSDPHDSHDGIPATNIMDDGLQRLIALKSGISLRRELANQNADGGVLIKDGDTTIDTSKTAIAGEAAMKRLQKEYDDAFNYVYANRSRGTAIENNWVPLPYPWSTPNMMPGEVSGPTY